MTEIQIPILIGRTYKHKRTGHYYEILLITNIAARKEKQKQFPITVVYKRLYDRTIWSRTLDSFLESFEIES